MPHDSSGQAGANQKGVIEITPQILEAMVEVFRDWVGEERSAAAMPREAFQQGLVEILEPLRLAGGLVWRCEKK